MIFRHDCLDCGYKGEDTEKLLVCPDCNGHKITNDPPVKEFSDDDEFVKDDDPKEKMAD